ncbi:MAG TPA: hypothetical protein VEA16_09455 [Vicinamibacterales bacterium]|nr:hypothetical protein [Vicinamibacterales bacterium]
MMRLLTVTLFVFAAAAPSFAQQRPLKTEDPETIGSGRILFEAGVDYNRDAYFPVSGARGNHLTVPGLGVSLGVSSIAEIQLDWGMYQQLSVTDVDRAAPLAHLVRIQPGGKTADLGDIHIGAKVRLLSETANRPAIGSWFSTRLPNSSNEDGMGKDVQDFSSALTIGKTVQSVRVVASVGMAMLGNPIRAAAQDDVLIYGLSVARAVTQRSEVVGEFTGRANFGNIITPGAEDTGVLRFGLRYTVSSVRFDAGVLVGLTPREPAIGVTTGFTWVFNGLHVP